MEEDRIKAAMIGLLMEKAGNGFSEKVLEYGNHPINCGTMDNPDGYAKVMGPCGDTVEMFLRIRNDKIENVSYTTDGCMTSHAAASAAVVLAMGRPVREGLRINQSAILEHLGGMPEEAQHCALLAAKTFQKALWNYTRGKKSGSTIVRLKNEGAKTMRDTFKAEEIRIGFHPEGYRIDKTASPMDFYTKWQITPEGEWINPKPTCFHSMPQEGWYKESQK